MADILYQHPEATTDSNASSKLPVQAMAFSRESGKFIYKMTEGGIQEVPSLSFLAGDFLVSDPANLVKTAFLGTAERVTDALNELYGMIGNPGEDNYDMPWLGQVDDLTTAFRETGWGFFTGDAPTGTPYTDNGTVLYQCIAHGFGGGNSGFVHQILTNTTTGKIYTRGITDTNGSLTTNGWILVNPSSTVSVTDSATIDLTLSGQDITASVKPSSINTAQLADNAVTTVKITDANVTTAKIADSAITSAKIADGTIVNADINASAAIATSKLATQTATSVLGRSANSTGTPAAIAATADGQVLKRSAGALSFGQIVNADITDGTITVAKIATSSLNTANGLAKLDASGLVPSSILPSYVNDVLEYSTGMMLPATGETGKIYITLDTNESWRWSGSTYVKIADDTASGVAGGDLTGSYPNPSIASSAVTTAKLANEAVSLAKLGSNSVDRSKLHGTIYKELNLLTASSVANSGIIEVCNFETYQFAFSLRVVLGRSGGYGNERVFDISFANKSSSYGDVTTGDLTYTTPDAEEEWELVVLGGTVGSRIALKRTYGLDTHVFDANVNGFIFGFAESTDGAATQTLLFGSCYGTESLPVGATTTKINGSQSRIVTKLRLENFYSKDGWGAKVGGSKGLLVPSFESGKSIAGEGITYWAGISSVTYPFSSLTVGAVEASYHDGANAVYVSKPGQTVSFSASDFDATTPFCQVYLDVVANTISKKKGALTDVERLTKFPLFIAYSSNLSTVSGLSYNTMYALSAKSVFREMFNCIGNPKRDLAINWTGTGRALKMNSGALFAMGSSPSTLESPNTYSLSANASVEWLESKRDGLINPTTGVTSVNVTQWDNNGTLTNIQNNKFVNHRLFAQLDESEPSKMVYILQLGQAEYSNLTDATSAVKTESFTRSEATKRMVLLAVISVKQGSSDLSSTNCTITSSDIWGGLGGLSSSSSSSGVSYLNFYVVNTVTELKTALETAGQKVIVVATTLEVSSPVAVDVHSGARVFGQQIKFSGTGALTLSSTSSTGSIQFYNDILVAESLTIFGSGTAVGVSMRNLDVFSTKTCTLTAGKSYERKKGLGIVTSGLQEFWDNTYALSTDVVLNWVSFGKSACSSSFTSGAPCGCIIDPSISGQVKFMRLLVSSAGAGQVTLHVFDMTNVIQTGNSASVLAKITFNVTRQGEVFIDLIGSSHSGVSNVAITKSTGFDFTLDKNKTYGVSLQDNGSTNWLGINSANTGLPTAPTISSGSAVNTTTVVSSGANAIYCKVNN